MWRGNGAGEEQGVVGVLLGHEGSATASGATAWARGGGGGMAPVSMVATVEEKMIFQKTPQPQLI